MCLKFFLQNPFKNQFLIVHGFEKCNKKNSIFLNTQGVSPPHGEKKYHLGFKRLNSDGNFLERYDYNIPYMRESNI